METELLFEGTGCRVYRATDGIWTREELREVHALGDDVIIVEDDGRDELELLEEVSKTFEDGETPDAIVIAVLGDALRAPRG